MKIVLATLCIFWCCQTSFGQGSSEYDSGIKLNLDEEGSKYIRFVVWNQIWARSIQNNPGSMINDESADHSFDIANRRLRLLMYAQFTPRYLVFTHVGINNQSFVNGGVPGPGAQGTGPNGAGKKPGIFFHDAWNEYAIVLPSADQPFSLSLGGGLHYYMGLSRATMSSTLNIMTVDAPIFNWPLIENSDQFARQMGFFAKGKYAALEYRFSVNKPFATNLTPTDAVSKQQAIAVDNNGNTRLSTAGYVEYQFFERESNLLPFKVGSYLGTRKVFNLGAGFYRAPKATRSMVNGEVDRHDIRLFSADAFLDLPIGMPEKKAALTMYSVFYNYDMGPNYLRNLGIMNLALEDQQFTGTRALAGPGNLQPMIGTGKIWYTQAGYLIPTTKEKPKARLQPFGAYAYKNFEQLQSASSQFDIGANLLLDGHHAKITGQYSTRPVYRDIGERDGSRGEFILQLHIYL